jgi:hypothetical protein
LLTNGSHTTNLRAQFAGGVSRLHTYDDAARQALIRQHWFEESNLRTNSSNTYRATDNWRRSLALKSDQQVSKNQWQDLVRTNPAAGEFLAQAELWQSHFEERAGLNALADEYPADLKPLVLPPRLIVPWPISDFQADGYCSEDEDNRQATGQHGNQARIGGTSTPTVNFSRKPPRTGIAFKGRSGQPAGYRKRPAFTGTILTLITLSVC